MARARARFQLCLWVLLLVSLTLTNCVQRKVTTKKRSYSIAGSGGEPDDSNEMKKRYASGFYIGEDGTMQTNKKELYADKSFRNTGNKDAVPKLFRSGNKDFSAKEFKTPEYLNRQKDFRTKDSSMNKEARESDVDRFTTINGTDEAYIKKSKPGFLDWLNPFSKRKAYRGSEKTYNTSINRAGSNAISSAPSPEPMSHIGASPQEQTNPSLSMDDVKKMLNPGSFRQQNR